MPEWLWIIAQIVLWLGALGLAVSVASVCWLVWHFAGNHWKTL